jgi:hypothetical protein
MRNALSCVFTSVFVAIINNKAPAELTKRVVPAALNAGLPETSLPALAEAVSLGTAAAYAAVPGITNTIIAQVKTAVGYGYAAAYAYVSYAMLAIFLFGFLVSFLLPDFDPYLTGHISRKVYAKNGRPGVEETEKKGQNLV